MIQVSGSFRTPSLVGPSPIRNSGPDAIRAGSAVLCGVFHPVPSGIPMGTGQSPHFFPKSLHDAIKPPHRLSQTNLSCRIANSCWITFVVQMVSRPASNNPKLLTGQVHTPQLLQGMVTGEATTALSRVQFRVKACGFTCNSSGRRTRWVPGLRATVLYTSL